MQLISTMATPLLVYGATAVFECIDPTTDLAVTGVTVTDPVLAGVNLTVNQNTAPPPAVAPLFVPLPANAFDAPPAQTEEDDGQASATG